MRLMRLSALIGFLVAITGVGLAIVPKQFRSPEQFRSSLKDSIPLGWEDLVVSDYQPEVGYVHWRVKYKQYEDPVGLEFYIQWNKRTNGPNGVSVEVRSPTSLNLTTYATYEFERGKLIDLNIYAPLDDSRGKWAEKIATDLCKATEEAL